VAGDELSQLELFVYLAETSEHSCVADDKVEEAFQAKDRKDRERIFGTIDPSGEPTAPGRSSLAFDSRIETGLPRVTTPARPFPKRPQRVADRPRSEEWNDDELLTLPEAAALYWPAGPITTNTLRTAGRDGTLAITKVAGKFFTTPMAIRRMGLDEVGTVVTKKMPEAAQASPQAMFQMRLAEAKRLGSTRTRPRRIGKVLVTPNSKSDGDGQ
jgi:hypothetical protein